MDKKSLIRTIVLVVALINQALVATNLNPISGSEEVWGEVTSIIITGAVAVWAWFKNNYVTAKGKAQKEVIEKAGLK
ncbi:phage holin [Paraliobacillus ryukyuensis]|uniref:phage holin n=1 Tax=Paraliobacillus ryukyuensis TaxID=200904 RepID=UPI0009A867CB|nr:phage holin [Paraliobacillus ryukyuensis]